MSLASEPTSTLGHMPLPQARCHRDRGDLLEVLGGPCPGQLLRVTRPYDPSFPMAGAIYDLVRNHPGHKYEWCYVRRTAPPQEAST